MAAAIQPVDREAAFFKMAAVKMVAVPAARNLARHFPVSIHTMSPKVGALHNPGYQFFILDVNLDCPEVPKLS